MPTGPESRRTVAITSRCLCARAGREVAPRPGGGSYPGGEPKRDIRGTMGTPKNVPKHPSGAGSPAADAERVGNSNPTRDASAMGPGDAKKLAILATLP